MSYVNLLTETVTYWPPATNDGTGDLTFGASSQLLVRWQNINDNFQDIDGEEFISDAIVYATQEFEHNGWLYYGTSSESDPQDQQGAYRIRRRMRSQNPNGSIIVYKHILG